MDEKQQQALERAMDDVRTARALLDAALGAVARAERAVVIALEGR